MMNAWKLIGVITLSGLAAACSAPAVGPGGVTEEEAQALDDAAAMLEARPNPADLTLPETPENLDAGSPSEPKDEGNAGVAP